MAEWASSRRPHGKEKLTSGGACWAAPSSGSKAPELRLYPAVPSVLEGFAVCVEGWPIKCCVWVPEKLVWGAGMAEGAEAGGGPSGKGCRWWGMPQLRAQLSGMPAWPNTLN
eukprot:1160990-Pelagomonas_calceolata.AAC.5